MNLIRLLIFLTPKEKDILKQLKDIKSLEISERSFSLNPKEIYKHVYKGIYNE